LPNGLPDTLLIADGQLDGWQRYPEVVADLPDTQFVPVMFTRMLKLPARRRPPPRVTRIGKQWGTSGMSTRTAICI